MAKKNKFLAPLIKADLKNFNKAESKLPRMIANEAVNFFTMNFRRQGFLDGTISKWKPRKKQDFTGKGKSRKVNAKQRGVLIGKGSGNKLSRSIRPIKVSKRKIIVGSTVHYAGVHNYGLRAGRGAGFKMPQRKFVGHSNTLLRKIRKLIIRKINKAFDKK